MSNCGCQKIAKNAERKILWIALFLKISMFIMGIIFGQLAQSTGLIADSLDMLLDALAYSIILMALGRSAQFKIISTMCCGVLLFLLGIIALAEVVSRAWLGDVPNSTIMITVASFSLIVNASILKLFTPFRQGEAYLKATWVFTCADIIVNSSVIFSGGLIILTHSRYPDLCIGFLISLYVMREGWKIWRNVNRH